MSKLDLRAVDQLLELIFKPVNICRIESLIYEFEMPIECLNLMIASLNCKIECLSRGFGFEFWRGWIPVDQEVESKGTMDRLTL